jgi:hypothetical protein
MSENPIDYRLLLLKYISHVGDYEGCTFIPTCSRPDEFTEQEWEELERLDLESMS